MAKRKKFSPSREFFKIPYKEQTTQEKEELSIIWGVVLLLVLIVIGVPAFRDGALTGLAVLQDSPEIAGGPFIWIGMWLALLVAVLGAAVLIDRKRRRAK